MTDLEQLGAFYLGARVDETFARTDEPLLLDASDLTTHAVIVGMTGSGKTGLGVALIEEAAIDGVPVLVIDPKGDMGNLALTFPGLEGRDLEPWLDPRAAEREGTDLSTYAAKVAREWRDGLASWGQDAARVERLRRSAPVTVYTPGSTAGVPISVLRSFAPPARSVLEDPEALAERLGSTAAALLALVGRDTDPLGRDSLLLTAVLDHAWRQGRELTLTELVRSVQTPPVKQLGVLDVDVVYPAAERTKLALAINALLASPSFEPWTRGVPLDVQRLLYEDSGRPRIAVVTIGHLGDAERLSFLTLLLSEVVSWTRSLAGTSSLRALVYVDELFGMLPPVSEPPTKRPLLTLLKQARAFGVGLVLSTQNPVDLDYKALSNAGTWFVGRLQTERDKQRLLDGLRAASGSVDVGALDRTISALPKRTFVLHSVHEPRPTVFTTRWVMSYLAGPLSRAQLARLGELGLNAPPPGAGPADAAEVAEAPATAPADLSAPGPAAAPGAPPPKAPGPARSAAGEGRPVVPPHLPELFAPAAAPQGPVRYYPFVLGVADVIYRSKTHGVDEERRVALLVEPQEGPTAVEWSRAEEPGFGLEEADRQPAPGAAFAPLPDVPLTEKAVKEWRELFERWLRGGGALRLWRDPASKLASRPGESEQEFRLRCAQAAREARDEQVARLRERYQAKLAAADKRVMREEQAVAREQQQLQARAVSVASTVLGGFLGGRRSLSTAVNRAAQGAKDVGDVQRAKERLAAATREREELQAAMLAEIEELQRRTVHPEEIELETVVVTPTSRDIAVRYLGLAWVPFVERDGRWARARARD